MSPNLPPALIQPQRPTLSPSVGQVPENNLPRR